MGQAWCCAPHRQVQKDDKRLVRSRVRYSSILFQFLILPNHYCFKEGGGGVLNDVRYSVSEPEEGANSSARIPDFHVEKLVEVEGEATG